jgi:hypothetical protein
MESWRSCTGAELAYGDDVGALHVLVVPMLGRWW